MKCLKCDTEFPETNFKKKFCSVKCQTRYNSLLRYNRLKDDPEFKKKNSDKFKEWHSKNRERHNTYMRKYMQPYAKRRYWEKKNDILPHHK